MILVALALVLAFGGVTLFALTRRSSASPPADAGHPRHADPSLQVVGTTPASGATNVDPGATLTVSLSSPIASGSPMPTLSPPVPGQWSQLTPTELQFVASAPLTPGTQETLSVPGGPQGIRGTSKQLLASSFATSFTVAQGSELRLQEILAQLGYLPLQFTPVAPLASPQDAADPQPGTFSWRWSTLPSQLLSQWTQGTDNEITSGAVMTFEADHNLTTDGNAGPQVWSALLTSILSPTPATNPHPYAYALVTKTLPESITVWNNGGVLITSPVNTGIPQSPTNDGTFPVYERLQTQVMRGHNPNGTAYADPVAWVAYFNGGDAIHYINRATFGYPQSLGCVEVPYNNAATIWPNLPIGSLVTVQG